MKNSFQQALAVCLILVCLLVWVAADWSTSTSLIATAGNLTVTDMTGKVVLQKTNVQESVQISLSLEGLSNGLYQVTANNTLTGEISQQKVVVQK